MEIFAREIARMASPPVVVGVTGTNGKSTVTALAAAMGRSSGSIAMKLANFASLDPKITESGRKGLEGAHGTQGRVIG